MPMNFLYPYISMLDGAAWSIQQSLDGLGLSSTSYVERDAAGHIANSYWSPGQTELVILGSLILLAIPLCLSLLTSGYILARRRGACLMLAATLTPGCLSLLSLWPAVQFSPVSYTIDGAGILGSPWGMFPLVALGLVAGWCTTMIIVDITAADERFWHSYDHLWYAAALLAGIFFVADASVREHLRDLQENTFEARQTSAYLQKQAAGYDQWCHQTSRIDTLSCRWASDVQQKLLDYSVEVPAVFKEHGPKTSSEIYAPLGGGISEANITTIRTEIAAYNRELCPIVELGQSTRQLARPSARCLQTPIQFCNVAPDPLNGTVDRDAMVATVALASECLIPTLVALRTNTEKLVAQDKADRRTAHLRWMYYVFFSAVVGGKIAGATVKLASMHKRAPSEHRRTLHLIRRVIGLSRKLLCKLYTYSAHTVRELWKRIRALFNRRGPSK